MNQKFDLHEDLGRMVYAYGFVTNSNKHNAKYDPENWIYLYQNDSQFHNFIDTSFVYIQEKYFSKQDNCIKEQLCIYCNTCKTEPIWHQGTRILIAEDSNRFNQINTFCDCTSALMMIHTHPMGNCKLSEIDRDSLKGWRFGINRNIVLTLISGMQRREYRINIHEKSIRIEKFQRFSPKQYEINPQEELLILDAIVRSNYV